MEEAGYGSYWKQKIEPKLLKSMADYAISPGFLDDIHLEINALSGPEPPDNEYPKTYVLDIGNAFNLLDKTFCTTYLLLDREMAKKFRIDFILVYIHENLHRLRISPKTMQRLEELKRSNEFYRRNEAMAEKFGEGLNEAFVVAAESYTPAGSALKQRPTSIRNLRPIATERSCWLLFCTLICRKKTATKPSMHSSTACSTKRSSQPGRSRLSMISR